MVFFYGFNKRQSRKEAELESFSLPLNSRIFANRFIGIASLKFCMIMDIPLRT